jgi:hypothetical protein
MKPHETLSTKYQFLIVFFYFYKIKHQVVEKVLSFDNVGNKWGKKKLVYLNYFSYLCNSKSPYKIRLFNCFLKF